MKGLGPAKNLGLFTHTHTHTLTYTENKGREERTVIPSIISRFKKVPNQNWIFIKMCTANATTTASNTATTTATTTATAKDLFRFLFFLHKWLWQCLDRSDLSISMVIITLHFFIPISILRYFLCLNFHFLVSLPRIRRTSFSPKFA